MKHTKYTAIASLVYTLVPFISALISNYITVPFAQETSFKVIMWGLFLIAWFVLAHIIVELPDELLQKFKLIKMESESIQGYWLIEYEENSIMACSVLEIRDNCGSATESILKDFSKDLSELSKLGVQSLQFNGDNQLTQMYAKGTAHHSFIRFKYKHQGEFDIVRIDDDGNDIPSKKYGTCREITKELVRDTKLVTEDKMAKRMLDRFALAPNFIENLLVYVYKNKDTAFAREVIERYNAKNSSLGSTKEFTNSSENMSAEIISKIQNISIKKEG